MNQLDRAEEHLKTIRRLMERATIYRAISAPTALTGGLLSLAACAVLVLAGDNSQGPYKLEWQDPRPHLFLAVWLAVLLLTAGARRNEASPCSDSRRR